MMFKKSLEDILDIGIKNEDICIIYSYMFAVLIKLCSQNLQT